MALSRSISLASIVSPKSEIARSATRFTASPTCTRTASASGVASSIAPAVATASRIHSPARGLSNSRMALAINSALRPSPCGNPSASSSQVFGFSIRFFPPKSLGQKNRPTASWTGSVICFCARE